jgi:hypothetical protein
MNKLMVYYYDLVFDLLSTELGCKLKDFGNMLKDGAQAQEGLLTHAQGWIGWSLYTYLLLLLLLSEVCAGKIICRLARIEYQFKYSGDFPFNFDNC